ncbi:hypothetical protein KIMH_06280 [Bombiscardovia apis]|uniref:RHS protein conserved region domain-containing protein n=1 Tax=Bombiscardovia apis TaxID=2932182 RepID=A0ABM8BC68_9BIFI|nr:RHS repeat-associated core domain-containing protein [Bombiscardovia apis]BDR54517.1 hypothetical protein KIMH_06280 [Bombiscardovia apis]
MEEIPLYADGTPAYNESIQWLYKPNELEPFARYEKGQLHYVVCDQIGTPRELFDERGNLKWLSRHDIWGKTNSYGYKAANDDTVLDCHLRYLGQYSDDESGLHYNRFRYYDPDTGQYISPDPIGLSGGINPYGYAHNPLT